MENQNLSKLFNTREVNTKLVPKFLISEQKESRINIIANILNIIFRDPGLLDRVITYVET